MSVFDCSSRYSNGKIPNFESTPRGIMIVFGEKCAFLPISVLRLPKLGFAVDIGHFHQIGFWTKIKTSKTVFWSAHAPLEVLISTIKCALLKTARNSNVFFLFIFFPPKIRSELLYIAHSSIPQTVPQKVLRRTPKSISKHLAHHKPSPNWFLKKKNFGKNFHFFLWYRWNLQMKFWQALYKGIYAYSSKKGLGNQWLVRSKILFVRAW